VVHRVGRARVLRKSGEQRRLREVQVLSAFGEVVPGGRLDAIGLVAVVDEVEVALEDLVLAHGLLELDRVLQLL